MTWAFAFTMTLQHHLDEQSTMPTVHHMGTKDVLASQSGGFQRVRDPDTMDDGSLKSDVHLCDFCHKDSPELCCFTCDHKGLPYHKDCWRDDKATYRPVHEPSPIEWLNKLDYLNEPNKQNSIRDSEFIEDDLNCFIEFDTQNEQEKYRLGRRAFPLLPHIPNFNNKIQFPSFISFVGRTASGKSFLIRALQHDDAVEGRPTPIPAPGADVRTYRSTSGDIHLYADSVTGKSESPILFLDCEGFEGSDMPRGVMARMDVESARKRKAHVEVAYPRFIYAFSTCVVFVTSGPPAESRDIQRRLVSYASKGGSGSKNQGFKPSLFLVFNRFREGKEEGFKWSIDDSTNAFRKRARDDIAELDDFYSNIRVVYIPDMNADQFITALKQLDAFNTALREEHEKAFRRRQEFHLAFISSRLEPFLRKALKHFSDQPDLPFDWAVEAPKLFLDSTLADLWTQYLRYHSTSQTAELLYDLVRRDFERHVTFCLRLMLSRNPPCNRRTTDALWAHLKQLDDYIPCGAKFGADRKCEKVRFHHGQYHECFTSRSTQTRWAGEYEACEYNAFQTEECFKATLEGYTEKVSVRNLSTEKIPTSIRSMVTCIGCLQGPPSTVLACGHAFCSRCVRELTGDHPLPHRCKEIPCPIHGELQKFSPRLLPKQSGYRILSLDGGGVKGLAQLVMLRAIEEKCFNIPVIHLFDLVVGTNIGGQIALALNTPVPSEPLPVLGAMVKFRDLMKVSFERKRLVPFAIVSMVANATKYKAKTVERQLKDLFGEGTPLFSAATSSQSSVPNVAVTTVTLNAFQPYLIANYNRKPLEDAVPLLLGTTANDPCMTAWAAARCTSAAVPYFKPLEWQGRTLLDGGFKHNCPAVCAYFEAKSIWPNKRRDVLLSLGTGRAQQASPKTRFFHVVEEAVHNMTDADGAWDAFSGLLGEKEGIFRLNPEYEGAGFALDEFRKLDKIESQAQQWTANQNGALTDICNQLIAALFFFRPLGPIEEGVQKGEILCRLPTDLEARQSLINRMLQVQEQDSNLFEVRHDGNIQAHSNVVGVLENPPPADDISLKVSLHGIPAAGGVKIHVKMRSLITTHPVWSPISGSPYDIWKDVFV